MSALVLTMNIPHLSNECASRWQTRKRQMKDVGSSSDCRETKETTYIFLIFNEVHRYFSYVCQSLKFDLPESLVCLRKSNEILRHDDGNKAVRLGTVYQTYIRGVQSGIGMTSINLGVVLSLTTSC
jgi:hypothetical protein